MVDNSDMGGIFFLGVAIGIVLCFITLMIFLESQCENDNNVYDCTMYYTPTERD